MLFDRIADKKSHASADNRYDYVFIIQDYLDSKGLRYDGAFLDNITDRQAGKKFCFNDHVKAMIYSFLSNQTKWINIEPKLDKIDKLFFDYDADKLSETPAEYLYDGIFRLKCGNVKTKEQMKALKYNISLLHELERKYGSLDRFVLSAPAHEIVPIISDSKSHYKLRLIGEALAWEYLRNVGIDGAKPDTHMRRFLGADRMGNRAHSPATIREVIDQVDEMFEETGILKIKFDNIIWSYCAEGYGTVCKAIPDCDSCVIRKYCNYNKK